ncbi:MAG: hypothetical protein IH586_01495 [Anaerolineaceae bacterium]|nr:hypothetical protein [Anaerolineaceae bacterium]
MMEIASTTLILVGVICIVLGFFASVLLNTLRDDETQPIEDGAQGPPGGKKGRYTAIVRLWRENKTGAIVVEMDGRSFVNRNPLNESQQEEMEHIARDFRGWLGMGMANYPPAGAVQAFSPAEPSTASESTSSSLSIDEQKNPAPVARKTPLRNSGSQPSIQPPAAPVAAPVLAAKSIVMQIEDILQDMVSAGPLANQGIHLSEDPARGVMVSVGGEKFEGIDSVPDPSIKATIRAAVAEWENHQ